MANILIIGATGSVGSVTRNYFLENTTDKLTLMARNTRRLGHINEERETALTGSVADTSTLLEALKGQDAVFAALSGNLRSMASSLVNAMDHSDVKRLLFITSMGIYNEIPASVGASGNLASNPVLQNYRDAADVIEASDLNYTIIRPGWFDNGNDTSYEVTKKGEPFGGHDVSRKSIADLVVRLAHDEKLGSRDSLGINRK
ncbi:MULTISPECIES: NAD(P)H-binding protein [Pediococcus]|uniref:NAD(P)-dependent oxidoreductase n=1 Tax=Pediococcus parvulus TaxID=54062 RepID=A0A176TKK8_9LACO|nr:MULTISPECIES: NAD(P)H-binding protein [Pediococcus]MCT3027936.1 NAD-dependent epimerase/dehydratase family protein [Pediococcus parvulus]MCT3029873.1 NAD-dependent epimerase/dehydratase family protein [Pediococcus parvulus]MDV7693773.1 NAD(P)H-binding protein [Pediococcus parvulus]OAD64498.1 NAD(P)-dependent oxidoreductase [Pediococcus parvulus]GEL90450.1 NAD(P)-dependent oxidoreductase [Pediococcus parvulus]